MTRFDANLYRIATMMLAPVDPIRFYLCGVHVESCVAGGVLLVATDWCTLICIRDETGETDRNAIVRLTPEALRSCKPGKGETREVRIEDDTARVVTVALNDAGLREVTSTVAISEKCLIDGTFPDWRRVVPSIPEKHESYPAFRSDLLTRMSKIAEMLVGRKAHALRILSADEEMPALVQFGDERAFGVIMPIRFVCSATLPEWL